MTIAALLTLPIIAAAPALAPARRPPTSTSPSAPQADLDTGIVQGAREGGLEIYCGIPFAAPPISPLRWWEPQPVAPWQGVSNAQAFAPTCTQTGVSVPGETPPKTSEDCL